MLEDVKAEPPYLTVLIGKIWSWIPLTTSCGSRFNKLTTYRALDLQVFRLGRPAALVPHLLAQWVHCLPIEKCLRPAAHRAEQFYPI